MHPRAVRIVTSRVFPKTGNFVPCRCREAFFTFCPKLEIAQNGKLPKTGTFQDSYRAYDELNEPVKSVRFMVRFMVKSLISIFFITK